MTDHGDQQGSVRDRALKGTAAFGVRGAAIRLTGLLGSVVLARLLTPGDFGLVSLGIVLMTFGGALATGGLGAVLIQQAEPPVNRQLRVVYGFQLLLVAPLVAGSWIYALIVGGNAIVVATMSLGLPIAMGRIPPAIVCERELAFRPLVLAEIFETLAYNVIAIALVAIGAGVIGVAIAVIVRSVVGTGTLMLLSPLPLLRPVLAVREARPLLRLGFSFQSVALLALIRDTGANVVLALVAGLSTVGYWSVAQRLLQPIQLLIEPLYRVLFPSVARINAAGGDATGALERTVGRASVLIGFVVVALAGSAPALVPMLFGPGWSEAVPTTSVAAIGVAIYGPLSFCGTGYLLGLGHASSVLRAGLVYTIGWLMITVVLVPITGAVGVAVAMVIAGFIAGIYLDAVLRSTGAHALRATLVPVILVVVAAAPALLLVETLGASVLSLLASLAAAEIAYLVLVLMIRRRVLVDLIRLLREVTGRDPRPTKGRDATA